MNEDELRRIISEACNEQLQMYEFAPNNEQTRTEIARSLESVLSSTIGPNYQISVDPGTGNSDQIALTVNLNSRFFSINQFPDVAQSIDDIFFEEFDKEECDKILPKKQKVKQKTKKLQSMKFILPLK